MFQPTSFVDRRNARAKLLDAFGTSGQRIGAQGVLIGASAKDKLMTNVVNLRNARKRAMREKAAQDAANKRQVFGVSKAERNVAKASRELGKQKFDQHKIERGDRR